jgi:hypothetical protein
MAIGCPCKGQVSCWILVPRPVAQRIDTGRGESSGGSPERNRLGSPHPEGEQLMLRLVCFLEPPCSYRPPTLKGGLPWSPGSPPRPGLFLFLCGFRGVGQAETHPALILKGHAPRSGSLPAI